MTDPLVGRRTFMGAVALLAGLPLRAAQSGFKHQLKKALIVGKPEEAALRAMKEAGFDGVEAGIVSPEEAVAARAVAEGLGMRIHSVMRGWASFNSDKPEEVTQTYDTTVAALRAAHGYGADAVLLVPCKIGGMAIPAPWDFKVEFDAGTSHLTSVVAGDNAPYADYIAAHNHAQDTSTAQVKRLIPIAAELQVVVALENVWNNLWVDPHHFAHFVDSFQSPWVKAYLDLGNHVKYSATPLWVRTLGPRIAKCHVKDFQLNDDGHDGKFVDIRDGSVDWPEVRRALDDVGYAGWMTIEGSGGLSLEERSKRLDEIVAGE